MVVNVVSSQHSFLLGTTVVHIKSLYNAMTPWNVLPVGKGTSVSQWPLHSASSRAAGAVIKEDWTKNSLSAAVWISTCLRRSVVCPVEDMWTCHSCAIFQIWREKYFKRKLLTSTCIIPVWTVICKYENPPWPEWSTQTGNSGKQPGSELNTKHSVFWNLPPTSCTIGLNPWPLGGE